MGQLVLREWLPTDVPTPPSGYTTVFIDATTGLPSAKDDTGAVSTLRGLQGIQGVKGDKGDAGTAAPLPPAPPVSLVSPVTSAVATDMDILVMTVPQGGLLAGSHLRGDVVAAVSNGTTVGTLTFWVKVNGTKILTAAVATTTTGKTAAAAKFDVDLTFRTAGATQGTVIGGGLLVSASPATVLALPVALTTAATFATNQAVTVSLGFSWAAAVAANTATAHLAALEFVK